MCDVLPNSVNNRDSTEVVPEWGGAICDQSASFSGVHDAWGYTCGFALSIKVLRLPAWPGGVVVILFQRWSSCPPKRRLNRDSPAAFISLTGNIFEGQRPAGVPAGVHGHHHPGVSELGKT
jgi:hypothetical protein